METPELQGLWELMNFLKEQFAEAEKKLAHLPVTVEGCNLSIKRHGQHMRIFYEDKPLTDCSVTNQIAAAQQMETLRQAVEANAASLRKEAEKAVKLMDEVLNKL